VIKYSLTKNFVLILTVYFYSLVRGNAKKSPVLPPKRVVIMYLTTNIGDMIFATPVFRALKNQYPQCQLSVIGSLYNRDLLENSPDIDDYIVCPNSTVELIKKIKLLNADYGATLTSSSFDVATMFLAGVSSIAAFTVQLPEENTLSYNILKKFIIEIPYSVGCYVGNEFLKIVKPLNIYSENTKKILRYSKNTEEKVNNFFRSINLDLAKDSFVVFAPGAGQPFKQWPAEKFAIVAKHISNVYTLKVALIGGSGDTVATTLFRKNFNTEDLIDFNNKSLDELKCFISKATLIIANDSGSVYIAEAFNIPTIVLVGPTDENEHPPHGQFNVVVTPDDRKKNIKQANRKSYLFTDENMKIDLISESDVIKKVELLLSTIGVYKKN